MVQAIILMVIVATLGGVLQSPHFSSGQAVLITESGCTVSSLSLKNKIKNKND